MCETMEGLDRGRINDTSRQKDDDIAHMAR